MYILSLVVSCVSRVVKNYINVLKIENKVIVKNCNVVKHSMFQCCDK